MPGMSSKRKAKWARLLMVYFLIRAIREKRTTEQMKIIQWMAKPCRE